MNPSIYNDPGMSGGPFNDSLAPLVFAHLVSGLTMPQNSPSQETFGAPPSGNDPNMPPLDFANLSGGTPPTSGGPPGDALTAQIRALLEHDAQTRSDMAKGSTTPVPNGLPRPGASLAVGLVGALLNSLDPRAHAGAGLAQGFQDATQKKQIADYQTAIAQQQQGDKAGLASLQNNQSQEQFLLGQQARGDQQKQHEQVFQLQRDQLRRQMSNDDANEVDKFLSRLGGYKNPTQLKQQLTAFEIARKGQGKTLPSGWDVTKQGLIDDATAQYQKLQQIGQYTKAQVGLQKKYADVTNQGATKIPASYRVGKANEIVKELSSYLIPNENGDPEIIQHNARIQAQIDGVNGMLPDLAKTTDAEKLLTSQLGISQSKATLLADQVKNFDADHAKKMALLVAQTDHYKTQADQWAQKFAQSNQQFAYKQYFSSLAAQTPLINHQKDLITHQLEVLNKQVAAAGGTPNEAQTNQIQALNEQYGKLDSQAQLNENEMGRYQQYQVQQASNAGQAMQGRLPQGPTQSGPPIGGSIRSNGSGRDVPPFDPTDGGKIDLSPISTRPKQSAGGTVGSALGGALGTSNPTPKKQSKGTQKTKSGVSFTFK